MSDRKDEPLIPYDGDKHVGEVIDLAGVRLRWGQRSPKAERACEHKALVFCSRERRVWCEDCDRTIDSFDAFYMLTKNFESMVRDIRAQNSKVKAALDSTITRRATKELERMWGHKMAAACPHCRTGLLAEDFADGVSAAYGRDYEIARRKRAAKPKEPE